MPDLLVARTPRQHWARPGSGHDRLIATLRLALPALIGVIGLAMIVTPLLKRGEISFVLDKDNVALARERMRVTAASYRGADNKGQSFELRAGSAVQTTSADPVVQISDISAQLDQRDGPATIAARSGRYDMDKEIVSFDGPIVFRAADGYRLETRDVAVGLKSRKIASGGPVDGRMPLGSFSANRMSADLEARTVRLDGRARLRIVQGRGR